MLLSRSTYLRILLLFALCLVFSQQLASATVMLGNNTGKIPLTSTFDLFEDKQATLDINAVTAPGFASNFHPLQGNLSASYSKSAFWLRLKLQREHLSAPQQWLIELSPVMLDDIRLYVPQKDGTTEIHRAGDRIAFSTLEIRHRFPTFLINLPDTEEHVVYLRIQSTSSVFLRATLWSPIGFAEESNLTSNLMGIYYGIMLAMIVYNLMLATSYRDMSLLFYLLLSTTTLTAGMSVNGHLGMYIAPDWPWLVDIMPGLISPVVMLCTSLFMTSFLRLKANMPVMFWVFRILQIVSGAASVAALMGYNHLTAPYVQSLGFIQIILVFPVSLICGWRGNRTGYIVFIASTAWMIGVLLLTLRNLGIIEPSRLTDYGFQVGSALEVILLALAQADRINLLKREKAQAQTQLLAISQRSEQELDGKVKQRTSELADAVTRLQKLDKEKNEFLGIAAHDLKNPLTSIIGMSNLLHKLDAQLPETQRQHYLERISHSGQRMMHIITNLLDVNAMETGHLHLKHEAVDLHQILTEVSQQYSDMLLAKELQLVVSTAAEPVIVRADPDAVAQLFDNLISNAIKYSPLGKSIWLSISTHQHMGRLQVRDEGPGLSKQDQAHLFEKFTRLSPTPTAGEHSSGLGLFIVKKLSEAFGGHIQCDSEVGQGCTFTVDIPLMEATDINK